MDDLSITFVEPSMLRQNGKRATKACVRCHKKKIRCDSDVRPNGQPCKNCLRARQHCRDYSDKRTRRHMHVPEPEPEPEPVHESVHEPVHEPAILDDDFNASTPSLVTAPQLNGHAGATFELTSTWTGPPLQSNSQSPSSRPPVYNTLGFIPHEAPEALRSSRNDSRDPSAAGDPLSHLSDPLNEKRQQAAVASDRFQAFVADNLGSYTPTFVGQSSLTISQPTHGRSNSSGVVGSSILPGDSSPRPQAEVYMDSRSTAELERQFANLSSGELTYLKYKGAFDLPPRELQEDMINSYFTWVNPTLPVINRTWFLNEFRNHRIPSLLLLFAIFTAGCKACCNVSLMDKWGTNLESGKHFYEVTKALLDTGHEPNKLFQVQAYLLMTYWWDKKDDGGQSMRGCAANALNIAQSIGMNRWDQYPLSDPIKLGLWKRVWWGVATRDSFAAVAHGLPRMLKLSECDVHPLKASDFIEEEGMLPDQQTYPYALEEIKFYIEEIKLCEILGAVFTRQYCLYRLKGATTGNLSEREAALGHEHDSLSGSSELDTMNDDCDQQLEAWFSSVPSELYYDIDRIQDHRFLPAFLHIIFFTILCARYRERSVARPTTRWILAEKNYSRVRGFAAATMISKIVRNLKAHGHVMKCTGFLTHALFQCMIYHMVEGQSPDPAVVEDAQRKYTLGLHTLYDFSHMWLSASLIHRLFEAIQSSTNLFVPRARLGGALEQLDQPQYPAGIRVSSNLRNSHIEKLLAERFSFEPPQAQVQTLPHSDNPFTNQSVPGSGFFPDTFDPSTLQGGLEFPNSLNIGDWCDFYDLGEL